MNRQISFFLISFLFTFFCTLFTLFAGETEKLTFDKKAKEAAHTFTLDQLIKKIPPQKITLYEPHSAETVVYWGFPFNKVLSLPEVYGEKWKKREEILFTCQDGYQPSVAVKEFLDYPAYLAYKIDGDRPFVVNNKGQNEKNVPLGPFYLVWDNEKHPELKVKGAASWPYQIVKIKLINFSELFPHLAPKKQASQKIKDGFVYYKKYCLSCHSLNGEGGGKGPDLADIFKQDYKEHGKEWLKKFISNPRSLRPESNMTQLNPDLKNRDEVIDLIMGYLTQQLNL